MTALIVLAAIVVYLTVLAAWVAYWGRRAGLKGQTSHKHGYNFTDEATWAAWGVVWPLFLPAAIVVAPFALLYFIGDRIGKLYHKSRREGLAINSRKHDMVEAKSGISVITTKKPLPVAHHYAPHFDGVN